MGHEERAENEFRSRDLLAGEHGDECLAAVKLFGGNRLTIILI